MPASRPERAQSIASAASAASLIAWIARRACFASPMTQHGMAVRYQHVAAERDAQLAARMSEFATGRRSRSAVW